MITLEKMSIYPTNNSNILFQEYPNGQNAIYIQNGRGEPLTELSFQHNAIELSPDEVIIRNTTENVHIIRYLLNLGLIEFTNRYVMIGPYLCPICHISP